MANLNAESQGRIQTVRIDATTTNAAMRSMATDDTQNVETSAVASES
ncbi:MAG: hypothetical protein M3209_11190 [Acidobacteriota bacterium]|nr:hypothetical protein [Acidobacteriota bacterium]